MVAKCCKCLEQLLLLSHSSATSGNAEGSACHANCAGPRAQRRFLAACRCVVRVRQLGEFNKLFLANTLRSYGWSMVIMIFPITTCLRVCLIFRYPKGQNVVWVLGTFLATKCMVCIGMQNMYTECIPRQAWTEPSGTDAFGPGPSSRAADLLHGFSWIFLVLLMVVLHFLGKWPNPVFHKGCPLPSAEASNWASLATWLKPSSLDLTMVDLMAKSLTLWAPSCSWTMRERITFGSLGGFLQRSWKQPIWQNLAPKVAQLQAGDSAIDGMEDFTPVGKITGKRWCGLSSGNQTWKRAWQLKSHEFPYVQ